MIAKFRSDPALIAVAEDVAARRPDLRLAPTDSPAGLTYDSSPVTARGGRALTLSTQDGFIPNLHRESDTFRERRAPMGSSERWRPVGSCSRPSTVEPQTTTATPSLSERAPCGQALSALRGAPQARVQAGPWLLERAQQSCAL